MTDKVITVVLGKIQGFTEEHFKQFQKRAAKGTLRCEYGNPKRDRQMSDAEWQNRFQTIDENKVCAAITSVDKAADGHSIIGTVKFIGPMAKLLHPDHPDKMVFATRALRKPSGELLMPITFDYMGIVGAKHD